MRDARTARVRRRSAGGVALHHWQQRGGQERVADDAVQRPLKGVAPRIDRLLEHVDLRVFESFCFCFCTRERRLDARARRGR